MKDEVLEFFDPIPPVPTESQGNGMGAIINLVVVAGFTLFCVYQMYHFAWSGALGSIGVGMVMIFSISLMSIILYFEHIRMRSYLSSTLVIGVFGAWMLVVNLNNAKPINNDEFQEVYKASIGMEIKKEVAK